MALTCSSRGWLSDLNVNVSTFISFITRLSRLAKSPLLVDLDHTLMMTTRFLIYIMPKIVPWATFQNSGRDDLHKDIFTSIRAVGCVQKKPNQHSRVHPWLHRYTCSACTPSTDHLHLRQTPHQAVPYKTIDDNYFQTF